MKQPFKILDVRSVRSERHLHHILKAFFNLPQWYGNNWDAFEELVSDFAFLNTSIEPVLVVYGFSEMMSEMPIVGIKLIMHIKNLVPAPDNPIRRLIIVG